GQIQLSKTLADLGIDDRSPLTAVEKSATVSDLLKARSGVYHPALYETPGMATARPARGSYAPGVLGYYNNWDLNPVGTIFERAATVTSGGWRRTAGRTSRRRTSKVACTRLAAPASPHRRRSLSRPRHRSSREHRHQGSGGHELSVRSSHAADPRRSKVACRR